MRDKHIIYHTEVDAQAFCITDKHITDPSVEQYPMPVCLQQDRQPMLYGLTAVIRPVV
jgi:hypothetical protein